jgi:Methyltransferase domain
MNSNFAYNLTALHTSLIAKIVELTGCETYLELGVYEGWNIKEISQYCNNCIGVDITDIRVFKDFDFRLQSTDDFFKSYDGYPPNIIFIDADHNFEQVKKDFKNSLNCLSEYGIIFLHDTDPTRIQLLVPEFCGDSYKTHNYIKQEHPELNIITLPISEAGLTIVNRDKDKRVLKFTI